MPAEGVKNAPNGADPVQSTEMKKQSLTGLSATYPPTKPAQNRHKICLSADFLKLCYNDPTLSSLLIRERTVYFLLQQAWAIGKTMAHSLLCALSQHFKKPAVAKSLTCQLCSDIICAQNPGFPKNQKPFSKTRRFQATDKPKTILPCSACSPLTMMPQSGHISGIWNSLKCTTKPLKTLGVFLCRPEKILI